MPNPIPAPAALRSRILTDHRTLRELLATVDALAQRLLQGDSAALALLRERGLALTARFGAHLALEDRELVPVLDGAGPEGRRHAERVRSEHEEQRLLLEYIVSRLEDQGRPTVVLGRELEGFVRVLIDDMDHEEHTVLGASSRHMGATSTPRPSAPTAH